MLYVMKIMFYDQRGEWRCPGAVVPSKFIISIASYETESLFVLLLS